MRICNLVLFNRLILPALILFFGVASILAAAETLEPAGTNVARAPAETSAEAQQALRAYLQLQEQVHQTMLAVEQTRKETQESARQNAELIAARLKLIEQAVSLQRDREAENARSSSRFALVVAACLGTLGLLVMLLTAWFLMRTARQFSVIAGLPGLRGLSHQSPVGLLADSPTSLRVSAADESGVKLLSAIERLEKRIHDVEHANPHSNGKPENEVAPEVSLLLGKGQSLLHLDQPEEAVACFNEVLSLDPNNTEALVKKGTAFEKLKRLEDAVTCYDRAIAVDESMTLAWLYKGGVFNQLERFGDALQCYEKALRTQQKIAVH